MELSNEKVHKLEQHWLQYVYLQQVIHHQTLWGVPKDGVCFSLAFSAMVFPFFLKIFSRAVGDQISWDISEGLIHFIYKQAFKFRTMGCLRLHPKHCLQRQYHITSRKEKLFIYVITFSTSLIWQKKRSL